MQLCTRYIDINTYVDRCRYIRIIKVMPSHRFECERIKKSVFDKKYVDDATKLQYE